MIQVLVAHSYTLSIQEAEGNTPSSQSHPGLHTARITEGDPVSKLQAETKMKNKNKQTWQVLSQH